MSALAKPTVMLKGKIRSFENINRFLHPEFNMVMAKILPGEYYVTNENEIIGTILGSCVSVCLRDTKLGIGGMNHFLLPSNSAAKEHRGKYSVIDKAARYGVDAMEHLINDVLKYGGKKNNFEFKICGGGKIMKNLTDIGQKNISFIKNYMEIENYAIDTEDLGGIYPRKIRYFPQTGKLMIMKLRSLHNDTIVKREINYRDKLNVAPVSGEVEIF